MTTTVNRLFRFNASGALFHNYIAVYQAKLPSLPLADL